MLIATGSATSWMADKIEANQGGLHARVTCNLHLSPFNLHETEEYLRQRNCRWRSVSAWMGLSFELVCLVHPRQIKAALGIAGVGTAISSWRSKADPDKDRPGVCDFFQKKNRFGRQWLSCCCSGCRRHFWSKS